MLGLGIGTACCIVAYLNWQFEKQWDAAHQNAARIYRVQFWNEFQGNRTRYGISPVPLGNHIRENIKLVDDVVRFAPGIAQFRIGNETFEDQIGYGDRSFFNFFTFDLKYGTFSDFSDKSKLFISDELARKYFSREDVVGNSITQIVGDRQKEYTIGGVFSKQPLNSSFYTDAFTLWDNYWFSMSEDPLTGENDWGKVSNLFVTINDPAHVSAVAGALKEYVEIQNLARPDLKVQEYYLENFKGMAFRNRKEPRLQGETLRMGLPIEATAVPNIMAIFLLLLACFNFTNTSIASSSKRLKEIGIRKVIGSSKKQLIIQFLGENIALCFLGLLCGLVLAEFFVPAYDTLAGWLELKLDYSENTGFLLFLAGLFLFTSVFAGSYSSFYITSFNPTHILKGNLHLGGTNWFTRTLLALQFFIAVLSVVFAGAFYSNAKFQADYDLGFTTNSVISCFVRNEEGYNTYRNALSSNPDIKTMAGSKNHITNYTFYRGTARDGENEILTDVVDVGDSYIGAMDIKIIAGRNFRENSETDRRESILVSEEFVRKFKWEESPVGKHILWKDTTKFFIIGVVKNIYSRALWSPIEPLAIRYAAPGEFQQIIVRTTPGKMEEVDGFMRSKWKEVFPNYPYNGQRVDHVMAQSNEINRNVVKVFSFLGFFCILLSIAGLYTMISLNILKKMKQIGVRKVLGASSFNIIKLINLEFIVTLSIASLAGGLGGYLASDKVMDSIWDYFKPLDFPELFVWVVFMLIIPLLITGIKTYSVAKISPVKTLREE